MVIIGTLAMIALLLIGVPSALALGVIAAVGEFVPYVGPIVDAIPAILVAMSVGPTAALCRRLLRHQPGRRSPGDTAHSAAFLLHYSGRDPAWNCRRHRVVRLGLLCLCRSVVGGHIHRHKIFYVRDTLGEETRIPGEFELVPLPGGT